MSGHVSYWHLIINEWWGYKKDQSFIYHPQGFSSYTTGYMCETRHDFSKFLSLLKDDVIKWTHFPRYWPFVRGIHRSPVNCPHKGQWRGASIFSLICAWINGWVNNRETGDLRRHRPHYDVTVINNFVHVWVDQTLFKMIAEVSRDLVALGS